MKIHFLFLINFLIGTVLSAQTDSTTTLLTKNFKFQDGVYLSLAAFQNNQPDYTWSELKTNLFSNPQTFITQVEYIQLKGDSVTTTKALDLETVWGISLDGIPYIRLPKNTLSTDLMSFAGLQVRGKICYFEFDRQEMRDVLMPVYNPLTRQPFRQAYVKREKQIYYQKMMDFKTGEIKTFNTENMLLWIEDDRKLWNAVNSLTEDEAHEKLFKSLLIYDDRQKIYIKKNN